MSPSSARCSASRDLGAVTALAKLKSTSSKVRQTDYNTILQLGTGACLLPKYPNEVFPCMCHSVHKDIGNVSSRSVKKYLQVKLKQGDLPWSLD